MTVRIIVATLNVVLIQFDPAKDKLNHARHGLSLALASRLAWDEALVWVDGRYGYDETRMIGLVPEGDTLYVENYT